MKSEVWILFSSLLHTPKDQRCHSDYCILLYICPSHVLGDGLKEHAIEMEKDHFDFLAWFTYVLGDEVCCFSLGQCSMMLRSIAYSVSKGCHSGVCSNPVIDINSLACTKLDFKDVLISYIATTATHYFTSPSSVAPAVLRLPGAGIRPRVTSRFNH